MRHQIIDWEACGAEIAELAKTRCIADLAKHFGTSYESMRIYVRRVGIKPKRHGGGLDIDSIIGTEKEAEIREMARTHTIAEMTDKLDCSRYHVKTVLDRLGIQSCRRKGKGADVTLRGTRFTNGLVSFGKRKNNRYKILYVRAKAIAGVQGYAYSVGLSESDESRLSGWSSQSRQDLDRDLQRRVTRLNGDRHGR